MNSVSCEHSSLIPQEKKGPPPEQGQGGPEKRPPDEGEGKNQYFIYDLNCIQYFD